MVDTQTSKAEAAEKLNLVFRGGMDAEGLSSKLIEMSNDL
jgi:hypothetical protein